MPRKRSIAKQIECVLHPIKVKEISQAYANKTMAAKNENIEGGYVNQEATIYFAREAAEASKIHTVLHELYHAFEEHTARMDEEAKADSFAAMCMRIFKPEKVDDLLMEIPKKRKANK